MRFSQAAAHSKRTSAGTGRKSLYGGLRWAEEARHDAIVISALAPDAVTAARRTCRALRQRWHDVPIFVGLWNATGDTDRSRQRLEAVGAGAVCTSFSECIALLEIRFSSSHRAGHGTPESAAAAAT